MRHYEYYVKAFFPFYLVIIISWSVFFIRDAVEDRLSRNLIIILSIIVFEEIFSGSLPHLPYFTFFDAILFLGYVYAAVPIALTLLVHHYEVSKKQKHFAVAIDKSALWAVPGSFILSHFILLYSFDII